ncbi:MAG: DUF2325 domain-containing protein [Anaerovoracaceae bacterium]
MSVVIIGGNDCMVTKYIELCKEYDYKAKVYTQMKGTLRDKIGNPDLLVLFTNTVSHKMVKCALSSAKGSKTKIKRCHSSSLTALKGILKEEQ